MTKQCPYMKADSHSTGQEIPRPVQEDGVCVLTMLAWLTL
jgi:hypothetical protein